MRYSPQLQQIASLFASYNRQIPQLRGAELCRGMRRWPHGKHICADYRVLPLPKVFVMDTPDCSVGLSHSLSAHIPQQASAS